MSTEKPTHAYRARCRCGNIVALATDRPENAPDVARWIKQGLAIERVTIPEARTEFAPCACEPTEGEA